MTRFLPEYEIYAIRYATRKARRADHFLGGDPHEGPMPMDYFVWVVRGNGRVFVVDSGFTEEISAARKREFLRCPADALSELDIDPATVEDVILTHLHYDHAGNFHKFPRARFHLQDQEMAYATGRYMCHHCLNHSFEVEDIVGLVRLNFKGRIAFCDGDRELAPGLTLHRTGGHSAGLQILRVHTKRGWVVLASDATHFYENMQRGRPFPTVLHVGEALEAFRIVQELAESPDHIIPGHDPAVLRKYPAFSAKTAGLIARLDVAPHAMDEAAFQSPVQKA